jgi:hypothetical protein
VVEMKRGLECHGLNGDCSIYGLDAASGTGEDALLSGSYGGVKHTIISSPIFSMSATFKMVHLVDEGEERTLDFGQKLTLRYKIIFMAARSTMGSCT